MFWEWLSGGESGSTTIRNIALVAAGLIALPLAIWRGVVANRQANTAQQGLLNERYQKGAEMLGNGVLSVRLGGIYALQRLAEESPGQYHIQIMRLFCAFVRSPTVRLQLLANLRTYMLLNTLGCRVLNIGMPLLQALASPPGPVLWRR